MLDTQIQVACYRWPSKIAYLSGDEASCALRRIFWEGNDVTDLQPYPCWGSDVEHWHLGRAREQEA